MKSHEACVRSFVGWLFAHRHPECLDGWSVLVSFFVEPREIDEHSEILLSQPFTPAFGPILIAVPWQQVASVEVDGSPVGRRVAGAPGGERGLLERVGVDPEFATRTQNQRLVLGDQAAGARLAQCLAGGVDGPP